MTVCRSLSKSGSGCSIAGLYFTKACGTYRFLLISKSPFAHSQRVPFPIPEHLPFGRFGALPFTSCVELSQPAQRADARQEAILASHRGHEPGYSMHAPAYRSLRDGERAAGVVRPDDRVLLVVEAHEVAVVLPLRLDELELAGEGRAHEDEHPPRSTPSSSVAPSGSMGPYMKPRRKTRWIFTSES